LGIFFFFNTYVSGNWNKQARRSRVKWPLFYVLRMHRQREVWILIRSDTVYEKLQLITNLTESVNQKLQVVS